MDRHQYGMAMARQLARAAILRDLDCSEPVDGADSDEEMHGSEPETEEEWHSCAEEDSEVDAPSELPVAGSLHAPPTTCDVAPQRGGRGTSTAPSSPAQGTGSSEPETDSDTATLGEETETEDMGGHGGAEPSFSGVNDHWGRPLSDQAASAARSYWLCQQRYDQCGLDVSDRESIDILQRIAGWRREYTRLVLGVNELPRGHRTYEPPPPPSQLEDPLPRLRQSVEPPAVKEERGDGPAASQEAKYPDVVDLVSPSPSPRPSQVAIRALPDDELFFIDNNPGGAKPAAGPLTNSGPPLDPEQAALVDEIIRGSNVFYTGSAGCGKSTVLKAFVRRLREAGKEVHIIAPTGRAALEVNGSTTWTYAGWTPDHMRLPLSKLREKISKKTRKRIRETDVIVIDEISMVENHYFERLNEVMKSARNCPYLPFGGVQVVVTGDFFQLPPVKPFDHCIACGRELQRNAAQSEYLCRDVSDPHEKNPCRGDRVYYDVDKWAFRSDAWDECRFVHVELKTIHRQSDEAFIRVLQKCRLGEHLVPADIDLLTNHPTRTGNAVKLFSTLREVQAVNVEKFNALQTEEHGYKCRDAVHNKHPLFDEDRLPDGSLQRLKDHRYERGLKLKKGMLVVLLANLDLPGGLINGSQGVICGFEPHDPAAIPRGAEGDDVAPIKHFEVLRFIDAAPKKVWPVVQFTTGVRKVIYADCRINEHGEAHSGGKAMMLCRTQIPLMAAWALSIHKAQGMTLDRVVVNVSRAFEEGQVYVALSRARTLEGLKIDGDLQGLAVGKGANAQVQDFYRRMFQERADVVG